MEPVLSESKSDLKPNDNILCEPSKLDLSNQTLPHPETLIMPVTDQTLYVGKEEIEMPKEPIIEMSRKQLYDEIWEISVAGVSKKYNIPYSQLLKQVKEADIPIPPSGYWTKLSFGKEVTKLELPLQEWTIISVNVSTKRMMTTKNYNILDTGDNS